MDDLTELFGEVIYSYTRKQAIADGELVDLTTFSFRPARNVCEEAGIKFPVAITRAAYNRVIQEDGLPLPPAQDLSGRTYDLVNLLRVAIRGSRDDSEVMYRLVVWNWREGDVNRMPHQELVTLKAVCGPGDDAEPVITIMLPDED